MEGARGLVSGACIDTCHAFSAGYDIRTEAGVHALLAHLGDCEIRLIHLNDSKGGLGSGVDRHEHIGRGRIGLTGLRGFLARPRMRDIPVILETPKRSEADDLENLGTVTEMLSAEN